MIWNDLIRNTGHHLMRVASFLFNTIMRNSYKTYQTVKIKMSKYMVLFLSGFLYISGLDYFIPNGPIFRELKESGYDNIEIRLEKKTLQAVNFLSHFIKYNKEDNRIDLYNLRRSLLYSDTYLFIHITKEDSQHYYYINLNDDYYLINSVHPDKDTFLKKPLLFGDIYL